MAWALIVDDADAADAAAATARTHKAHLVLEQLAEAAEHMKVRLVLRAAKLSSHSVAFTFKRNWTSMTESEEGGGRSAGG